MGKATQVSSYHDEPRLQGNCGENDEASSPSNLSCRRRPSSWLNEEPYQYCGAATTPKSRRRRTRLLVGVGCGYSCLLFHLLSLFWKIKSRSKRRVTRPAPKKDLASNDTSMEFDEIGSVCAGALANDEIEFASWMNRHCQGQADRICFLARLLWFRTMIHQTSNGLPCPLPNSWRQLVLDCGGATTKFSLWAALDDTLLGRIVAALGICHVPTLLWPACAVDALMASLLVPCGMQPPKKPVTGEMLARIRGRLVLMGILQVPTTQQQRNQKRDDAESYLTMNILSWDNENTTEAAAMPWKAHFVQILQDISSPESAIQPRSMQERKFLHRFLPKIFLQLGFSRLAMDELFDPLATHCRLVVPVAFDGEEDSSTESVPINFSDGTAIRLLEHFFRLQAQVLWKQRCCEKVARWDQSRLAISFKNVGLNLLRHARHNHIGWQCIKEARSLYTKNLALALQGVLNALRYTALVLWTVGRPQDPQDKTLSSKRVLSRRMFALQEDLRRSTSRPAGDLHGWIESVKNILLETSSMNHFDIQQGHERLKEATNGLDVAYKDLLEISSFFSLAEPDLVNEWS